MLRRYGAVYYRKANEEDKPQQNMLDNALTQGHKFFVRKEEKHGYILRLYASYENFNAFKIAIANLKSYTFHEMVPIGIPCKLFFDIDFKTAYPQGFPVDITLDIVNQLEICLTDFISVRDGIKVNSHPITNSRLIVLDIVKSNAKIGDNFMLSLHLTSNQIYFNCILKQKIFVSEFIEHITKTTSDNVLKLLVDVQVYKKNTSLRTIYSVKADENRRCIPMCHPEIIYPEEFSHKDHLYLYYITAIRNNVKYSNILSTLMKPVRLITIKKPIVNLTDTEKLNELTDFERIENQKRITRINNAYAKNMRYITETSGTINKLDYIRDLLNRIPDSYFDEDATGYTKRLSLTFAAADFLGPDNEEHMNFYIGWLRDKRLSLGHDFDTTLEKYEKAYRLHTKTGKHITLSYILALVKKNS